MAYKNLFISSVTVGSPFIGAGTGTGTLNSQTIRASTGLIGIIREISGQQSLANKYDHEFLTDPTLLTSDFPVNTYSTGTLNSQTIRQSTALLMAYKEHSVETITESSSFGFINHRLYLDY